MKREAGGGSAGDGAGGVEDMEDEGHAGVPVMGKALVAVFRITMGEERIYLQISPLAASARARAKAALYYFALPRLSEAAASA